MAIALQRKFDPTGNVDLGGFDLTNLNVADLNQLPESMQIKHLDLESADIDPKMLVALLAKLNPSGHVILNGIDLSQLTTAHLKYLPDGMQIQGLGVQTTRIRPDVLIALVIKLNPTGALDTGVGLRDFTCDHMRQLEKRVTVRPFGIPSW